MLRSGLPAATVVQLDATSSAAAKQAVTSTVSPSSSTDVAVWPGLNSPWTRYSSPSRTRTVIVCCSGSTIPVFGNPRSGVLGPLLVKIPRPVLFSLADHLDDQIGSLSKLPFALSLRFQVDQVGLSIFSRTEPDGQRREVHLSQPPADDELIEQTKQKPDDRLVCNGGPWERTPRSRLQTQPDSLHPGSDNPVHPSIPGAGTGAQSPTPACRAGSEVPAVLPDGRRQVRPE